MRVMVVHHSPSLTMGRYEAVVRGLTGGKPRLKSTSDVPTVHVAAETEQGFMVFDVFDSQEAFDRFRAIPSRIATEGSSDTRPMRLTMSSFEAVKRNSAIPSAGTRMQPRNARPPRARLLQPVGRSGSGFLGPSVRSCRASSNLTTNVFTG